MTTVKELELKLIVRDTLIQQLRYRINKAIELLEFDGYTNYTIEKVLRILRGDDHV